MISYQSWNREWIPVTAQIAKFMGPTWGPPGSCRSQIGPMLAPWTRPWTWLSGWLRNSVNEETSIVVSVPKAAFIEPSTLHMSRSLTCLYTMDIEQVLHFRIRKWSSGKLDKKRRLNCNHGYKAPSHCCDLWSVVIQDSVVINWYSGCHREITPTGLSGPRFHAPLHNFTPTPAWPSGASDCSGSARWRHLM